MHEQLTPNHQAMSEVIPVIDTFRSTNELGAEVKIQAAERIEGAAESLDRLESVSGEGTLDRTVADYIDEAVEHTPEVTQDAVAVGVVDVLQHPNESPRTIFELGHAPVEVVGVAMHDLDDAKGHMATETVIEAIETAEQQHEQQTDALWRTMADYVDNDWVYTSANAKVTRLPLSLPVRNLSTYSPDVVQYASGDELEQVLEGYGVDAEVIDAARADNWNLSVQGLPKELRRTMNVANVYEAITLSHDEDAKLAATERNSAISLEDIWDAKTLHHVTKSNRLSAILKDGQLGKADVRGTGEVQSAGGVYDGSLNFGRPLREVAPDATNQERMEALSYSTRGDVYMHYARPEGCYREGEEYIDADPLISLMSAGMPSTEISALMLRNPNDLTAFESTWEAVKEAGFYIPIFSAQGDKLFSKEDFESGKTPDAIQAHHDSQRDQREKAEARWLQEKNQREQEAASKGMSVDEYAEWRRQNIVRPQI